MTWLNQIISFLFAKCTYATINKHTFAIVLFVSFLMLQIFKYPNTIVKLYIKTKFNEMKYDNSHHVLHALLLSIDTDKSLQVRLLWQVFND